MHRVRAVSRGKGCVFNVDTCAVVRLVCILRARGGRRRGHENITNLFSAVNRCKSCDKCFNERTGHSSRARKIPSTIVNTVVQVAFIDKGKTACLNNGNSKRVGDYCDRYPCVDRGRSALQIVVNARYVNRVTRDHNRFRNTVRERHIIRWIQMLANDHTGMHLKVAHIGLKPVNFIVDFGAVRGYEIDLPNERIKPLIAVGLVLEHDVVTVIHIICNSRNSQGEQFTVRGNLVVYALVCSILIGVFYETFKEPLLTAGVLKVADVCVGIVTRNIL